MNQTNTSIQTRNVQIFRDDSMNCTCNQKHNLWFQNDYCIAKHLLKDFPNSFRSNQALYKDLQPIQFFCQIMKSAQHCNSLANLCVLSNYNLEKNSPCSLFFTTQTSIISNGNDYFQKTTPFLFYKKGKDSVDEIEKVLDYTYSVNPNDKVNFLYF